MEGRRLRKVSHLITDLASGEQPDLSNCKLIACIVSGKLEKQVNHLFFWLSELNGNLTVVRRHIRGNPAAHCSKLAGFYGGTIRILLEEMDEVLR